MRHKLFKSKNGLLWLVFCIVIAVFVIGGGAPQFMVLSTQYGDGFLERLDAEGHAIETHVGKSEEFLRQRLLSKPIYAASTFNDMAEAEGAIRTVLIKRKDLIETWLKTEKSNKKAFYWKMDEPVGRVLKRGREGSLAGNQVRVVLIRDADYEGGFFILTAYPELK